VPEVAYLPGVVDRHVHLTLVDASQLRDSAVVEVHDLGGDPAVVGALASALSPAVHVRYAGPFHTAVGGYPSGRSWAPDSAVRQVTDPADAVRAVTGLRDTGASAVKIALNADMPLLDEACLTALIATARRCGLRSLVHAEGTGQATRAIAAGADALVHTPWSDALPDAVIREAVGRGMPWISTLAIHEGAALGVAMDNARRFVAHGGRLLYGTDMGNGLTPVGVSAGELALLGEAGLAGDALLAAVLRPGTGGSTADMLRGEGPLPGTAAELASWLATAERRAPHPAGVRSPAEGEEP
jgi:imidazolonepropionase-like amidohydrolase